MEVNPRLDEEQRQKPGFHGEGWLKSAITSRDWLGLAICSLQCNSVDGWITYNIHALEDGHTINGELYWPM